MAEETEVLTTDTAVDAQETDGTVETETVETQESETQDTESVETTTESSAATSFSKDDIEWDESLGFTDEAKEELVSKYSSWFKDKESANAYIKELANANKINKENQAKKIVELEASWEKSLKTDADFGKDYEGNKKKVVDLLSKYTSESELAELDKYGFTKSPVLNRTLLKIAREFSDAKVVGAGQPATTVSKQPVDRFGNTMFDFTKKQ
jgi:hypothetical protein